MLVGRQEGRQPQPGATGSRIFLHETCAPSPSWDEAMADATWLEPSRSETKISDSPTARGWGLWHGVQAMAVRQEHNVELSALLVQDLRPWLSHLDSNSQHISQESHHHDLLMQGLGRRMNCASAKHKILPTVMALKLRRRPPR